MRYGGAGAWDFWGLYDRGEWEPETRSVLERFLRPGDWFLDIGAWIGPVSMWAVELGVKVVAVEPDPEAMSALTRNVPSAVTIRAAVTTRPAARLATPDGHVFGDSWSRLGDEGLPVDVIHPATLLRTVQPALVKIDVEGWEVDVLPALLPLLEAPVLVAWHEPWWPWPVDEAERRRWFDGFDCEGEFGGWGSLLAVPR